MIRDNDLEILDHSFRLLVEKYKSLEAEHLEEQGLGHLSPAHVRALHRIGFSRRERMTNLARHLRLTVGTLTSTIDQLVKKGYVQRDRPDEDRRVVEVALSENGHCVFEQIQISKRRVAENIFGRLNNEERAALRELLTKLSRE